jgi:hypothetical protein
MPELEKGAVDKVVALTSAPITEKFSSPEEELAYLRERIRRKESELEKHNHQASFERARLANREIVEYQDTPTDAVLHDTYKMPEYEVMRSVLKLAPEEHDIQIDELLRLVPERGIKNTLSIAAKMGSAHLEDDLHRALVQYISEGLPAKGLQQGSDEWHALHMTLYEVSLPSHSAGEKEEQQAQDLEKLLASMEQFYLGLLSVVGTTRLTRKNVFSVEIAVQQGSEEAVFYVAVPSKKKELFEKHLISIFPNARIEEARSDYNIFNYGGAHVGAYGSLARHGVYPLKEYKVFTHDPLNIMLSAFSKLKKHGEGAAIQFVIGNSGDTYNRQYKKVLDELRKGKTEKKAIRHGMSVLSEAVDTLGESIVDMMRSGSREEKHDPVDQLALDTITKKANSRIVPVNIRILASAEEEDRAEDILENIISTFNQFEDAQGNSLTFLKQHGGKLREFIRLFTFRSFRKNRAVPLSVVELTSMYHLSASGVSTSRELKQSRAKQVSAPIEVSNDTDDTDETSASAAPASQGVPLRSGGGAKGIVLGKNTFGGTETFVKFQPEDRLRHFYEIGQTGTGKTNLMKNMIIQDIGNGEGCCYIDPHGSDIVDILAAVPMERFGDVIYFDPGHTARPMGLNMMEYNPEFPEQKTFVVNEMFSIFEKLFGDVPEALGPMFQQYFRNGAMLVLEGMEPGTATMADIPRVLANSKFRHQCLANSKNPVVNQFWEEIAEKAGGEASLENIVPYITSKTDIFLGNSIMRPIISQPKSAFNFREIMNNRKILLVNLAKGRLGDLNSELLGLIVVGKFLQAALSRVDQAHSADLPPFYLYIDEFQNFTTPSIATILSEARKYKLSLNIAHQFIAQLDEKIRDAVFGNVGTKCVFRVGIEDAEFLEKQFQPDFNAKDIVGLDNYNAYLALLVNGKPVRPFNMVTLPPDERVSLAQVEDLKQSSFNTYGRDREEVEAEIAERYAKKPEEEIPDMGPFGSMSRF